MNNKQTNKVTNILVAKDKYLLKWPKDEQKGSAVSEEKENHETIFQFSTTSALFLSFAPFHTLF